MSKKKIKKPIRGADVTEESLLLFDWAAYQREQELGTTLRSKALAKIVDLVSEGEIEGLANGLKGVYLDNTPVQNFDDSYNFQNIEVITRNGTQAQTYIPGFEIVENTINVQTEATFSTSVTRTITNTDINAVRVIVSIPALYATNYLGETVGNEVEIKIELQSNGGGFNTVFNKFLRGKSTSLYERSFRVELTGSGPWDIRLTRVSPDPTGLDAQNKTFFKSYTEIIDSKLTYPNSALVAIKIDAAQFQNIPSRSYDLKLLKIKVPSNYDPITRVYTGEWDGTFQVLWSDNPAWCYYDMLTTERYGLGSFIEESQVDKWKLYEIGRYCDELVPDGLGGTEPRFTCNLYFQTREEAYKVLNDMTTIFRGMSYWASGSITAVQDSPKDAEYLFTNANVVEGDFNYSGASSKVIHTVAIVSWNDPEDFYKQKMEYVEDQEAVATYGIITTEVSAIGCTSRGQANRVGRWLLYTEQNESKIVTFKTGTEGAALSPGAIIKIADELVAGAKVGGRVADATSTTVTIDRDYTGDLTSATISVMLSDGTVATKTIQSIVGRVVNIIGSFSTVPVSPAIWVISTTLLEAQEYRVISVTEDKEGTYSITAMAYDYRKYSAVENNLELEDRIYTSLDPVTAAPTNLKAEESLFETPTGVRSKVTVSWDQVPKAINYQVQYTRDNDNPIILTPQFANELDIYDVVAGTYTFSVLSLNNLGRRSAITVLTKELYGKIAPPADVENFSLFPNTSNNAVLRWDQTSDLDVRVGGWVRIRWTPVTVSPSWSNAIDIIEAIPGNSTSTQVPLLDGTYFAKFIDSSGIESTNAAQLQTTVPYGDALNVVHTEDESGVFGGTKTNTEYNSDLGGLILSSSVLWDSLGTVDDLSQIDFQGNTYVSGEYQFLNTVDLGDVYPSRLISYLDIEGFHEAGLWDDRTDLIDDWVDIDGTEISDVNATLYVRTTLDDPGSSPTWDAWRPFFVGEYTARAYQFKLVLSSSTQGHNILVKTLRVTIDMPDRTENHRAVSSGTGTHSLLFNYAFKEVPSIVISAYNMGTGDYFTISNQTVSGFDISFKNSSDVGVSRNFDAVIKGYGRIET